MFFPDVSLTHVALFSPVEVERSIKIKRKTFFVVLVRILHRRPALKVIHTYSSECSSHLRAVNCIVRSSCFIDRDVCYITLCEKTFPRKNAYAYLEDLAQEFIAQYGQKIHLAARPYSFIEFGTSYSVRPPNRFSTSVFF